MARSLTANARSYLDDLEAGSIHILRETAAQFSNPVLMYSVGKDSTALLHLARKAFHPGPIPFPLLHVDTTWEFEELYEFRDQTAASLGVNLIRHINHQGVKDGLNPFDSGGAYTDVMKTQALLDALREHKFDAAIGGARRDEERSRAKERVFSFRDEHFQWEPKTQRPELWRLFNGKIAKGESVRVFPLSDWTEADVWLYILRENIPVVPLYFARERPVVDRQGTLIVPDQPERMRFLPGETPRTEKVRFRTLGCWPNTGAIRSSAASVQDIVREILDTRTSERQGRLIDSDEDAAMEKRKREGYF